METSQAHNFISGHSLPQRKACEFMYIAILSLMSCQAVASRWRCSLTSTLLRCCADSYTTFLSQMACHLRSQSSVKISECSWAEDTLGKVSGFSNRGVTHGFRRRPCIVSNSSNLLYIWSVALLQVYDAHKFNFAHEPIQWLMPHVMGWSTPKDNPTSLTFPYNEISAPR